MSGLGFLLSGALIGLSVAVPVGPIGILCIQRTLKKGWRSGLISGLGAASADATYGAVAAFGLTAVSTLLVSERVWIQLAGGVILLYLGVRTGFLSGPGRRREDVKGKVRGGDYTSTLILTMANPLTIVFFTAVFAGLGVAGTGGDYPNSAFLTLGVFSGSAVWWLVLSGAVNAVRERFNDARMLWLNRVSGGLILVFGLISVASALQVVP